MQASVYRTAVASTASNSTLTFSIACEGESRLLLVGVACREETADVTSVVYAGVPLTRLARLTPVDSRDLSVTAWALIAPPVGTANLRITSDDAGSTMVGIARSLVDADQKALPAATTARGTSTSPTSITIPATTEDLVLDFFGLADPFGRTASASQTVDANRGINDNNECALGASRKPGAANVTMEWDPQSSTDAWGHIVLRVLPGGPERQWKLRWTTQAATSALFRLRWQTRQTVERTVSLRWRTTVPVERTTRLRWTTRANVGRQWAILWLTDSKRIPPAIVPVFSTVELLELAIGQRTEAVRFEVVDAFRRTLFPVNPDRSSVITVANNANATIKRTLQGLHLAPGDADKINPVSHRLRAIWQLENGAEFPLGVFMFGDSNRLRATYGKSFEGTLFDQTFILDQGRRSTFALAAGERCTDAIKALLREVNLPTDRVADAPTVLANPQAWPAGTTRMRIINDLCAMASLYSVYFDNSGVPVCRPVPDLEVANAQLHYSLGQHSRVIRDSIVESDDLWQAPNVYVVVSTSANEQEVSGSYEIPENNPLSVKNRGFEVVNVLDTPGLETSEEAVARAKAAALQDPSTYRHVEFEAAPDPRHDTFDVVFFDDGVYREQSWSLVCTPGGPHRHNLRRVDQVSA